MPAPDLRVVPAGDTIPEFAIAICGTCAKAKHVQRFQFDGPSIGVRWAKNPLQPLPLLRSRFGPESRRVPEDVVAEGQQPIDVDFLDARVLEFNANDRDLLTESVSLPLVRR